MIKIIDYMNINTGWGEEGDFAFYSYNQHKDYIANNLSASMVFKVNANSAGSIVYNGTFDIDVSDCDEIVLWVWSRNNVKNSYNKASDFTYKMNFGGDVSYYIPTRNQLSMVLIDCRNIQTISQIQIEALHDIEDYLIISSIVAIKEEMPIDLYKDIKSILSDTVIKEYGGKFIVGITSTSVGDTSISITGEKDFIDRYSVIKIKQDDVEEIHQIASSSELEFTFTSMFDGKSILNDFTDAEVYIMLSIDYGVETKEIKLPAITIYGMAPEQVLRGSLLEDKYDSHSDDDKLMARREGAIFNYHLTLDCEARHFELLGAMSEIVRKFIARETIWINNKKYRMVWDGRPVELMPTIPIDMIPKVQYNFSIEIIEALYARQAISPIDKTNLNVTGDLVNV
jgi:hypothetical protein